MVSILIPAYNREKYIEETVRSAMSQTYKNVEIIVVDNFSTDNTWTILEELARLDSRIKIFQNNENIGPMRNWKRCVDEAKGDYGKIIWSDDLIAPEFIQATLPFLSNNPDVGFAYTGVEVFNDENGHTTAAGYIGETGLYDSTEYVNNIIIGNDYPLSPGCAIFRMKDLKKNMLIDIPNKVSSDFSMLAIGNDMLIFLLTAVDYKYFAFVNQKLSFFRVHSDSISIESNNAKLVFHYDIAKAYFLENYYKNTGLIKRLNVLLYKHLSRYKGYSKKFTKIEDFYINNMCFQEDFGYKLIRLQDRLQKTLKKIVSKIQCMYK